MKVLATVRKTFSQPLHGWPKVSMFSLLAVGITVAIWSVWNRPADMNQFPDVVTSGDVERAREMFDLRYGRKGNRLDLLSWLAEWYLTRDRQADAVQCFAAIPTSHPQYGRMARYQQGRTLLTLHQAAEAEAQFRELIAIEETSPQIEPRFLIDARQRLRHILEVELRFEERQRLLTGVIARGEADDFETIAYCFPSHLRWNGPDATKWLEEFHDADPDDAKINVALGRYRMGQGKMGEAREILEAVVGDRPDDLWAMSALIACLSEADDPDELSRRVEALPPQSDDDPWLLLVQRGRYAIQNGQLEKGIAAFELLLKQDRTSTEGWSGLLSAISAIKDETRRKQILQMTAGVGRIQNNLGKIFRRSDDPESYLSVIELCEEFGFDNEGWLLSQFVRKMAPGNPKVRAASDLFRSRLFDGDSEFSPVPNLPAGQRPQLPNGRARLPPSR